MVPHPPSIVVARAGIDPNEGIYVEGEVSAGSAACLVPRRYRRKPEWWVVEVVGVAAPSQDAQRFRLSCSAKGLWGTEGIEVEGPDRSIRIPIPGPRRSWFQPRWRAGLRRRLRSRRDLRS